MNLTSLLNYQSFLLLIFSTIIIVIAWNIFLHLRLNQICKKLKTFFNGKNASDLEEVLFEEIKRLKGCEKNIKELSSLFQETNSKSRKSLQKVGLVRFNPFKDTGGDQSFSLALLDYQDNGIVISSLYTRQGTRIYSKPIKKGKSQYPLSKEENSALKKAGLKI